MDCRLRHLIRSWVRRHPTIYALVRFTKYGPHRPLNRCRTHDELLDRLRQSNARILNLGSGARPRPGMINVDTTTINGPDVVADGHDLPFPDQSFDAIFCESVVEHVADPEAFLRAASRCLRQGGVWYVEVPFLQPVHDDRDFQRWTIAGFQEALRRAGLEPVASGTRMGVGFMMAWILREFAALPFGGSHHWPGRGVAWMTGMILSPMLLLDLIGQEGKTIDGLACSHYHVARRPQASP